MKSRIKKLIKRGREFAEEQVHKDPAPEDEVRITNETVAARREEVLRGARKYIYPLQASKHRVVRLSVAILVTAVVGFFVFCLLEFYKFQSTSSFMYGVSQVLPFPIAVIDHSAVVSYNDYLFELRHYMHYYQTQAGTDFNSREGKQQLAQFKQDSLDQVIQNTYVNELAGQHNISVSDSEVDAAVTLVRSQNRLGANDQVFQNVLSEFWGWSVNDFRRELRQELLAQKVVSALDTKTHDRADAALVKLKRGVNFGALAKKISDDTSTKSHGGDFGGWIDRSNTELPPEVINALFKLKVGHISNVINTGQELVIVKVTAVQGSQVRAAEIAFKFAAVDTYTAPLEAKEPATKLIHL